MTAVRLDAEKWRGAMWKLYLTPLPLLDATKRLRYTPCNFPSIWMASKGGGEADTWSAPLLSTEPRGGHRDTETRVVAVFNESPRRELGS